MFTGVARMECKALATQLALLRWQMHQRPWAGRRDQAAVVRRPSGDGTAGTGLDVLHPSVAGPALAAGSRPETADVAAQLGSPGHP
jgi:hypothetical protein